MKEKDLICPGRLIWVSLEGTPLHVWSEETFSTIAKAFGQVVEVEDVSIQKAQIHISRVCILSSSYMTVNEVVRLEIQGQAFSVRVLEDTAKIIDFGSRYEDADANDRMEDFSDGGRMEAGSDSGSDADCFILESPALTVTKLKHVDSNRGGRLDPVSTLNAVWATTLGNLSECEEAPFCMEPGKERVIHHNQLVAEFSGLGPSPVPIHNGVNVFGPALDGGPDYLAAQTVNKLQDPIFAAASSCC